MNKLIKTQNWDEKTKRLLSQWQRSRKLDDIQLCHLIDIINYAIEAVEIEMRNEMPDCDNCDRIDPENPPERYP